MLKQPCIDCGQPANATRCDKHAAAERKRAASLQTHLRKQRGGRPQYGGSWRQISRAVRATATKCWICGKPETKDDPFQADHILPAQFHMGAGPVAAAHRSCNIARGNRTRHQHKTQNNFLRQHGTRRSPHRNQHNNDQQTPA